MPKRGEAKEPRGKLKERAYQELRELLFSGEISAGMIVSERQLAERMKISKTPIRVALERLERDGFVEILPQRGIRVRGLTNKDVADHFDLRIALETWVVERLAKAGARVSMEFLHQCIDEQRNAIDAGKLDVYERADAELHDRLAVLTGNEEVVRVMRLQRERLTRIIYQIHHKDPTRPRQALAEHAAIVEALEQRDGPLAAERMRDHLLWGRRFLLGVDEGLPPTPETANVDN
jgi:DNA-binding GntR family transcriptional regulator